MKLTAATKTRVKKHSPHVSEWGKLIKEKRLELGETQADFGARFGKSYVAVSLWEAGKRDAPGAVTWWLYWTTQQENQP